MYKVLTCQTLCSRWKGAADSQSKLQRYTLTGRTFLDWPVYFLRRRRYDGYNMHVSGSLGISWLRPPSIVDKTRNRQRKTSSMVYGEERKKEKPKPSGRKLAGQNILYNGIWRTVTWDWKTCWAEEKVWGKHLHHGCGMETIHLFGRKKKES